MTRAEIIKEYELRIIQEGGYAMADCEAVARKMADDMDVPLTRVRTVMMSHWGNLQG